MQVRREQVEKKEATSVAERILESKLGDVDADLVAKGFTPDWGNQGLKLYEIEEVRADADVLLNGRKLHVWLELKEWYLPDPIMEVFAPVEGVWAVSLGHGESLCMSDWGWRGNGMPTRDWVVQIIADSLNTEDWGKDVDIDTDADGSVDQKAKRTIERWLRRATKLTRRRSTDTDLRLV